MHHSDVVSLWKSITIINDNMQFYIYEHVIIIFEGVSNEKCSPLFRIFVLKSKIHNYI